MKIKLVDLLLVVILLLALFGYFAIGSNLGGVFVTPTATPTVTDTPTITPVPSLTPTLSLTFPALVTPLSTPSPSGTP
jgi:hypothetical protein